MKRWIFLFLSMILFLISLILLIPYMTVSSAEGIFYLILILISFIFIQVASYFLMNHRFIQKIKTLQNRLSMWTKLSYHVNQVGDEVFNELPIGIVALDEQDDIKWANPHAQSIFSPKMINKPLKEINQSLYTNISNSKMNFSIEKDSNYYDVIYRPEYRFFYLFNVTEKQKIKEKYQDQIPALGVVYIDNLDETLATLDVSVQSSLKGAYLGAVSDWAATYDVYLKPYGDERLLLVGYRKQLIQMIDDKFDILDKIRNISSENDVRVTLSIGFASWDISYDELGVYAQNALELAEKRG